MIGPKKTQASNPMKNKKVILNVEDDNTVTLKYNRGSIRIPSSMLQLFSTELCIYAGRTAPQKRTFWANLDKMRKNSSAAIFGDNLR